MATDDKFTDEFDVEIDKYVDDTGIAEILKVGLNEALDVQFVERNEIRTTMYVYMDIDEKNGEMPTIRVRYEDSKYSIRTGRVSRDGSWHSTTENQEVYEDPDKAVQDVRNRLTS